MTARAMSAAHLSVQNNRPALVQELMAEVLSCGAQDIIVAKPDAGTPWLHI
jgi:hypothetical protein